MQFFSLMKAKRKFSVTINAARKRSNNSSTNVVKTSRNKRILISKLHVQNKKEQEALSDTERNIQRTETDYKSLPLYQAASAKILSFKFPAEFLTNYLLKELLPLKSISLLDVGALTSKTYEKLKNTTSKAGNWPVATVRSIDLNPRDPLIEKADLLNFQPHELFDIVCLSLVVNFVGCPFLKGDLIKTAVTLLNPNGLSLLYIVLPVATLWNSRYMTYNHFVSNIMEQKLGLTLVKEYSRYQRNMSLSKTGPKASNPATGVWCGIFKHTKHHMNIYSAALQKKIHLNPGVKRNNFCILFRD